MFEMDLKTALLFYRLCRLRKADTEEKRIEVMLYLAKKGKLRSVMQTNRTPDQVAKDMAKNFGKVLYIKPKNKKHDKRND